MVTKALDALLAENFVGKWATLLKEYCQQVRDTFNVIEEEHQDLSSFLGDDLYTILSNHIYVFSSSLVHSFYMGVNNLLNNSEFDDNLKKYIVALGDVQPPKVAVLNLFVGNFIA